MRCTPPLNGLLDFAVDLATKAGSLTLRYFQSARLRIDYKADATPVTDADRAAESFIRERLAEAYPDHAIMGEEFGERPGHPGNSATPRFRWIIDPIDGTKSFVRGVPLYGVLIGLEVDGVSALGVIHFPALNETVAAARGCGCRFNGTTCHVSQTDRLADATLLSSALFSLGDNGPGGGGAAGAGDADPGYDKLLRSVKHFRTWGDCYGYALVATGRADLMLDPKLAAWDCAPMLPILAEAGGRFTDLRGEATIHGQSGLASNGKLHDEVLALLKSGPTT